MTGSDTKHRQAGGGVLVAAATEGELSLLRAALGARPLSRPSPFPAYATRSAGVRLLLAVTGIGKANGAAAVTLMAERYRPSLVINCGCGGAYPGSGLEVGHLAIATTEVYGDDGVAAPGGWLDMKGMGLPLAVRGTSWYYNEFPLSQLPTEQAVQLAAGLGIPCRRGPFVTVSACSGTTARGEELHRRHGAICENMEGAAVAHAALLWGLDCLEVRGISNRVEDRNLVQWDLAGAMEVAQRFVLRYIETRVLGGAPLKRPAYHRVRRG
jgi:futalosine hydrolase